jgi:DNA repair protein RecO (recombination protein O)
VAPSLQPAFVLHRRPYRDSSLLLELLTRDQGRLAVIARGVRAGRRGKAGLLQPFAPLLVACRGRGEVLTLTNVEAAAAPFALAGQRLFCGLYVNELVLALTRRQDPHAELFAAYLQALQAMLAGADIEAALRRFEVQLLAELGFGLQLRVEADGRTPVRAELRYEYRVEEGPAPVPDGRGVSGATLLGLADGKPLGEEGRREAKRLLRSVLDHHLGGRALHSRDLFRGASRE